MIRFIEIFIASLAGKPDARFSWEFSSFSAISYMFGMVCMKFEVLYSIIIWNMVNVMDNFVRCKKSSKMFFHYKSMFPYISTIVGIRMFSIFYKNIAILINYSSAIPSSILLKFSCTLFFMFRCMNLSSILMSSLESKQPSYLDFGWSKIRFDKNSFVASTGALCLYLNSHDYIMPEIV